ncbi:MULTISPECIES: hypothetical protein [Devosia]|nr:MULTISPECIES: hypothetical protein [Devosia]
MAILSIAPRTLAQDPTIMRKTIALSVMFVASLGLLFAAYASVPM